ncbi:tetratricopeptide repeat protein [Candidatus Pelagibacter bacterium]|nr:tetratricopeptide repeat protein [Candidatus Pelagibacter bacterium]MDC0858675.1 tetratricopeptide repeat protein [Pelagibacteraceae bacterium]
MNLFKLSLKIIGQVIFVIIFFSTLEAKSSNKFNDADNISDYFSGILLLNDNQYNSSFKYLKKLSGLEEIHTNYSIKYLYSLINSGNVNEAFNYSRKLEKQKLESFESNLITGIFYLKKSDFKSAKKYFLKAKAKGSKFVLNNYVSDSLYNWSNLTNIDKSSANLELKKLDKRFENLKKIQSVFLNCYYNSSDTNELFSALNSNQRTDFSRYNYFHASYAISIGKINEAKSIVQSALKLYPRNLLLNQYKIDLNELKNMDAFDCRKEKHVAAEILYITANALSSQSLYSLSNFYLNLAKFLNEDFHSFETLLAENFYKTNNFEDAKKIYKNLSKKGEAFKWYSTKQLARIFIQEKKTKDAIKLTSSVYKDLINKEVYETFDFAEFLKNNEKFQEAIFHYTAVLKNIKSKHPLYPKATDGRGVAYERIGNWDKAEKDLLASLSADPDQAYVINYLAYSWIEKGIKIEKSLNMLEKANKLKSNDPFIIDSLGWALFKLERYKESKKYLQLAVRLMPGDPIVNDHYGDVLWKNGNQLQARYYWNYVLNLKKTEENLKKIIDKKLIQGL